MPRLLHCAVPLSLSLLLVACGGAEPPLPSVRPALVVKPEPASQAVESYPGEVRARVESELGFRVGGKISRRLVDVGAQVKKDQALAELDPQDLRLQLEAARAQRAAAEANLKLVRTELERYRTLLDRGLVSQSQFDAIENQYRAGEARLKQAQAEHEVADNQAKYAVLRAPADGIVARRMAEQGQVVAAGQPVFSLAADGEREVLIAIPEHATDRLRVGREVEIALWSQPGQRFAGQIRELSPAADSSSRTFAARVAFVGEPTQVELGQSARVLVKLEEDIPLTVPLTAVSAENDVAYVWVLNPDDSSLKRTLVKLGGYSHERASIVEGLKPEDWVVGAGVHVLRDGQVVRPVDRDNRPVVLSAGE